MKRYLFWVLLTCFTLGNFLARSQTRIQGKVTYNTIRPIANANIVLEDTYDGATSNEKGEFSFETTEKGTFKLSVKAEGFDPITQAVVVPDSGKVVVKLVLTTKSMLLNDVVVRPKLFDLNDKNKYTALNPIEILTTATDGNITSALKTMPGAQQIGESGDLFVRGGSGSETKVYIDGLLVPNYTYSSTANMAARSRFPPGLFKGTFFATGAYSAQYGQAMSSALMLESEDLPVKNTIDLTISPIMLGANMQQLSRDRTFSISGGLNYMNLKLYQSVAPGSVRFIHTPEYLDGNVVMRKKFKNGGMLKAYFSTGYSEMSLHQPNLDYDYINTRVGLTNRNTYLNLTYKQNLKGGWKWQSGFSYSRNRDRTNVLISGNEQVRVDSTIQVADQTSLWQARNVFSKMITGRTRLNAGFEVHHLSDGRNRSEFTDLYTAQFVETESYLSDRLSARVGIRTEYSSLLQRANIAPRLAIGYNTGDKSLLSFSYGKFFQKPDRAYLLQSAELGYSLADHYILSFQKLTSDRTFRTELFYKRYANLVRTVPVLNTDGKGYAQGGEIFYRDRKTIRGIDYWVSYSFLDTKRQFANYPYAVQPTFAARHTATTVVRHFFSGWQTNVGLTYTYASGRPFYNPNRPTDEFMQDRTIDYHNVGLSVAYLPRIKKTFSVLVLTVSNLLGTRQVFGYTYSSVNPTRREAIVPTNNPFIFLGFMTTIGMDRRQDIINNQL